MSILVKFSSNFDFKFFEKNSIFSKIVENFLKKHLILVKILTKIYDLSVKIFENFRSWSNFRKNFDFGQNYRKISILVKIFEEFPICSKISKNFSVKIFEKFRKFWFSQIIGKFRFWSNFFKIFVLFANFEKFRFWSNFRKISILVKSSENFRFFRKFRKLSIRVKLSKKISIFVKIFENFKNVDFSKIFV